MVDHIVTFRFTAGKREYRRDLVVPAPRGSSPSTIVRKARADMPDGAHALKPFLTLSHAEIVQGPSTTRRKTELR